MTSEFHCATQTSDLTVESLIYPLGFTLIVERDCLHMHTARARRPAEELRRVNVDFPAWMIAELDREATWLGVTRQSLIKVWIAEKLDHGGHTAA